MKNISNLSTPIISDSNWKARQDQNRRHKETIQEILKANPILSTHFCDLNSPLTIEEQYSHPLWALKCQEILIRDNCTCQFCKSTEDLQVCPTYDTHHFNLWEYDDEALVTACDDCHKILLAELPKLSGMIAFKILSGNLDLSTLNLQP